MPPAVYAPPPTRRRSAPRRDPHARSLAPASPPARRREPAAVGGPLAGYIDPAGRARELVALPGHAGSVLVLDRDAATLRDRRLVAHLAADEPRENAALVCRHYLQDTRGRWCRRVRPEDLEIAPYGGCAVDAHAGGALDPEAAGSALDSHLPHAPLVDRHGNAYRLSALAGNPTPQLRWCRRPPDADDRGWERIALRDVVAALESYEPVRTLTERAIARGRERHGALSTRLGIEFERLCASPIVLNRGLREAVLHAIDRRGMSMSGIALRCGIVKHDRRGKASGETSWLARRVGIMPEGGEGQITPWVHIDVLAAIARKGLGISPREVELQ